MSTSSRQEAMEGEPVRRHVSDAVLKYDKPVYGMFIAVRIDTNTAETFRHGVWYAKGDEYQRLNIVPFTLAQFQRYFELMFKTKQAKPEKLVELIDHCASKRDMMEAPAWKEYIDSAVHTGIYGFDSLDSYSTAMMVAESPASYNVKKSRRFPYGIYFGTKIKDTVNPHAISCATKYESQQKCSEYAVNYETFIVKNQVGCVVGIQEDFILVAFEADLEPRLMPVSEDGFKKGYFSLA